MIEIPRRSAVILLGLLALVASSANASDPDGWEQVVSTGGTVSPTTPEGGFGAPDRTRLDQNLRRGVLDQLCRQAQIPISYDYNVDGFGGVGAGIDRSLKVDIDNQVALIDDEKLRVGFSHGFAENVANAGQQAIGLSFGASIEGHSMVIRRTGTTKSCDEVLRLLDFRDAKTVLPMKGERLSAMKVGELWRIPFTLTYSEGISINDTVNAANGSATSPAGIASLSFGRSDSGAASMTLYRIADDKLRFRFRIDHVVVWSKSAGVTETYPPIAFAIGAKNILTRLLEREVANQLDQYTAAWLNFGRASADGKKMLFEFVIDPRDPAQADALAHVVRGDMRELVKLGAKMSTFQTASTMADYMKLRDQNAAAVGAATYAASDEYNSKTRTFTFNLPLFVSHNSAALFGEDKIERYTGEQGDFDFYRADKSKNNSYFTLPWVGPMVKNNSQRDVEAVTYAAKGGPHGDPIVVFIRNRGYLRVTGSEVREDVTDINSVLTMAGAQRGKTANMALPVDQLVPPSPLIKGPNVHGEEQAPSEPSDRKGLMSFTLVLNQQAVKDALSASTEQVLKAFAASLGADDRPLAQWLVEHGTLNDKGKLDYDWRAARRAFPSADQFERGGNNDDRTRRLDELSRQAAGLLADLAAGRNAGDNQARALALATMIGGKGKSDLAYEDALRVIVQLVDPMDLTGDFVANVSVSTKGVKSPNQHWILKKGRPEVPLLKDAGEAKARFAEPSILVD